GIALSSALVLAVGMVSVDSADSWRWEWICSAVATGLLVIVVSRFLPHAGAAAAGKEPALSWRLPLVLVTASYGLFGFGYVITATFLVTMARQAAAGAGVEFLAWFIAGTAAAVSLVAWRPFLRRFGPVFAYAACTGLEA